MLIFYSILFYSIPKINKKRRKQSGKELLKKKQEHFMAIPP
jgi:hypothetical protein